MVRIGLKDSLVPQFFKSSFGYQVELLRNQMNAVSEHLIRSSDL